MNILSLCFGSCFYSEGYYRKKGGVFYPQSFFQLKKSWIFRSWYMVANYLAPSLNVLALLEWTNLGLALLKTSLLSLFMNVREEWNILVYFLMIVQWSFLMIALRNLSGFEILPKIDRIPWTEEFQKINNRVEVYLALESITISLFAT